MLKRQSLVLCGILCFGIVQGNLRSTATGEPALPEDVTISLLNDLSGQLATKVSASNCVEFNEILDDAQANAASDAQRSAVITQVLNDVKANPKLRSIVISSLGDPMLKKTLECDLTPINGITADKAQIKDIDQLSDALLVMLDAKDCPAFNEMLDEAQANVNRSPDDSSLLSITQILTDAKTDPQSQSVMIERLGEPMLSKTLDCDLIPFNALRAGI